MFLLISLCAFAQSITGVAPHNIVVGESFRVVYDISSSDVEDFILDNLPSGIEEVMPPFGSTATVGGKTVTKYTTMLSAEHEGNFVLPAPKIVVKGREIEGKTLVIKVGNNSSLPASDYVTRHETASPTPEKETKADVFARIVVSKHNVVVNEPVTVWVYIYSKNTLEGMNAVMPEMGDFYTLEMSKGEEVETSQETIGKHVYERTLWAKYVVYPQHSGSLSVPSVTFRGKVKTENRDIDPFELALHPEKKFVVASKTIVAPSVPLNVSELPVAPENFSGAVGKFSMHVLYADQSVGLDEPAVIKVSIKGNGNIKLLKSPKVVFPKSFTVHDMQTADSIQFTDKRGAEGEMVYTYTASANAPGEFSLPAICFTYYDTDSCKYVTVSRQLSPLTVVSGKGSGSSGSLSPIRQLGNIDVTSHHGLLFSLRYFLIIAFMLLIFAILWQIVVRYRKMLVAKTAEEEKMRKEKETEYERRMIDEIRARFEGRQKTPLVLLLLFFAGSLYAFDINVERANDAYTSRDYQKAIRLYREQLSVAPSADVYYNLGNAYYQMREIGNAVDCYEHALLLNANDEDIRNNLALAQSKVKDKLQEKPEVFIASWYRHVVYLFTADTWAIFSLVFLAMILCSILFYHFRVSGSRRAFWMGFSSAVLFLLTVLFAFQQQWYVGHYSKRVIMTDDAKVYEKPDASSKMVVTIHEGETVEVIDSTMSKWHEVELSDGRSGWMEVKSEKCE